MAGRSNQVFVRPNTLSAQTCANFNHEAPYFATAHLTSERQAFYPVLHLWQVARSLIAMHPETGQDEPTHRITDHPDPLQFSKLQESSSWATSAEYIRQHREIQKENEDVESQFQTLLPLEACKVPENMLRLRAGIFVVEGERRG
jgi:hypothetical protein